MNDFEFILNNHFIVRHCTARKGNDTPKKFHCFRGLRKWSRFFYLDTGKIEFSSITGKSFIMESGDLLFLPYDIEYSSAWIDADNGLYYSVEFILEFPDGQPLDLYDDLTLLKKCGNAFRHLFCEIVNTVESRGSGFQILCQEKFLHLLFQIAVFVKIQCSPESDIQPAILYINENLHHEIDVDELAKMCHMSPATFRRKFIKYASESPIQYRNHQRMLKAKELISTGLYKVKEVTALLCISDASYFNRMYKKYIGNSPSEDLPI